VRCGSQQELQYDHIIPLARGGADTADNLQLLCAPWSRGKGDSIG
jgi:5-methylcytosine-specific restriction endonuclease McrA